MTNEAKIFDPESQLELLRGWLLHAHKARTGMTKLRETTSGGATCLGIQP